MFTVYVNTRIFLADMFKPFVSTVHFGDVEAFEFRNIEKMEWSEYHKAMQLFFTVNGKTLEVWLHLKSAGDIVAVYPEGY